jgi:RNA polymerase sigma-70 factor (ECF subfamily)
MPDWGRIREKHGPVVWETVYRILANHADACDCFQDVFTEVMDRSSPGRVRDWPAFLRWLATRRALNRLRQRRVEAKRVQGGGDASFVADNSLRPESQLEWDELVERVRHELARLPQPQGEAFWLRCIEQMSYAEIGAQLGVDSNAVGVLVHRARQKLRQILSDLNPVNQ